MFKLTGLLYDTFMRLQGGVSVTAISMMSVYANMMSNTSLRRRVMNGLTKVAEEASIDLGEDNIDALMFRSQALTHRSQLEMFDDTLLAAAEFMMPIVTQRYLRYEGLGKNYWYDMDHDCWMYRNCNHQLAKYWIHHGDLDKAVYYFRAATLLAYDEADEHWKAFAQVAESYLRKNGLVEQADDIATQRRRLDMPPEVREALTKEEIPDPTATPESLPAWCEEKDDDDD
jgi:hypothetical protein